MKLSKRNKQAIFFTSLFYALFTWMLAGLGVLLDSPFIAGLAIGLTVVGFTIVLIICAVAILYCTYMIFIEDGD